MLTAFATLASKVSFPEAMSRLQTIYDNRQTTGRLTKPIITACIAQCTQGIQAQTPPDTPVSCGDVQEQEMDVTEGPKTTTTEAELSLENDFSDHNQAQGAAGSELESQCIDSAILQEGSNRENSVKMLY